MGSFIAAVKSLHWVNVFLGCLIMFAAQIVLSFGAAALALPVPPLAITLVAMVIGAVATSRMVPDRKLLHGILVPVTYYVIFFVLIQILSLRTSGADGVQS